LKRRALAFFGQNVLIAQHGADDVKYKKEKPEMLLAPGGGLFESSGLRLNWRR
jgi:hypothetical protein